jgi:hypothetical protein
MTSAALREVAGEAHGPFDANETNEHLFDPG